MCWRNQIRTRCRRPDVVAFDSGLGRLYVSAESGTVTVFEENKHDLRKLGQFHLPHAHTVAVDPKSHLVYFPLENVDGHPLLRIMKPVQWQTINRVRAN